MSYVTAFDLSQSASFDLDSSPERWNPGEPFESIDIRPGRVVMIGAPPGVGKSTLMLQLATGILANHANLGLVVGNVETSAQTQLEKLLARFAAVRLDAIMNRTLSPAERKRVEQALVEKEQLLRRTAFLASPFTMAHLKESMQQHQARLCIIDYAQRFISGDDARMKIDELMSLIRVLADAGAGVLVVSSVARQKSKSGASTYDGLSLASFRGSAELEFGCDSAYILLNSTDGIAALECVKQRYGQMKNIPLRFNGPLQRFDPGDVFDAFDVAQEAPPATEKKKK